MTGTCVQAVDCSPATMRAREQGAPPRMRGTVATLARQPGRQRPAALYLPSPSTFCYHAYRDSNPLAPCKERC